MGTAILKRFDKTQLNISNVILFFLVVYLNSISMLRNVVERSSYVQSLLTGAFDGWVSVLIYQTLGGQICSRPARKIIFVNTITSWPTDPVFCFSPNC